MHNLIAVMQGKRLWNRLRHKYKINEQEQRTILFFSKDQECNYLGLLYLEKYLKSSSSVYRRNPINIISNDSILLKSSVYFNHYSRPILLSKKQIDLLTKYATISREFRSYLIISLEEPFGRECDHLIGIKGITKKELIVNGIYKLHITNFNLYPDPDPPTYHGNDPDISNFLKLMIETEGE